MALVDAYDSIIFDYGGVLVHPQSDEDQARMAGLIGIPPKQLPELYWARRAEYDRAALTAPEYWWDVAQNAGKELSDETIQRLTEIDTVGWMHFDEPMWQWIKQLKESGKRLAVLSNMPRELGEALKQGDRFRLFHHVTLSYETLTAKPDRAIYESCLAGLSATPGTTLFFDDRMENIKGAEAAGIHGIQFLNRDEVLLRVA